MALSLLSLLFTISRSTILNVNDFGTIPTINTVEAALNNSKAFTSAFDALQSNPDYTSLLFPSNYIYYLLPITIDGLSNKNIIIDSLVIANNNISSFPYSGNKYLNLMTFTNVSNLHFSGFGTIDGQGYEWWTAFLMNDIPNDMKRPNLFEMNDGTNITIQSIHLRNSPHFNFYLANMQNLFISNVSVYANTTQQRELSIAHNLWNFDENVPMFPFNTDGIDVAGKNITIRNCTIHNYDDSVCIKPSVENEFGCTEDVVVEDCVQSGGAGMSVGSVSPKNGSNCVQHVIFRNIVFKSPLKAIYVKTNPGTHGDGRIFNVTYENIFMFQDADLFPEHAFLWPIYIGPQQQKEPDGAGAGCFVEFIRCPTQPRVNVSSIYLKNVSAVNSVFTNPAVMNCNYTNPCSDFVFDNVKFVNSTVYHPWDELYVCKNVYGKFDDCDPQPHCFHNVTK